MAQLSKILRSVEGGGLMFCCPGCGKKHSIFVGPGSGPRWMWNADVDLPTFTPSILVIGVERLTEEEHAALMRGEKIEPRPLRCHSVVEGGSIKFLDDCTHALAGKTVAIPPFEDVN